MKPWKKALCAAAAVIAAVPVGLTAVSHLVWHRSAMATIAELVILSGGSKSIFTDPERCQTYIADAEAVNRQPYEIPSSVSFDISAEEEQNNGMQVFVLNGAGSANTVLFYIPGGAYINQPSPEQWRFCNTLAKGLDMPVILPVYPKLPEYDCEYAYQCMTAFYRDFMQRYSGKHVILMGDSAGGGFALGLAQTLRGEDVAQPDQLILLSPWIDLTMENAEMVPYEKVDPMLGIYGLREMGKIWASGLDVKDPRVSPIYGDMTGLGRITLFVGTREIFYPEIMRLDRLLTEAGIDHELHVGEGMNHVYPVYPIPEAAEAASLIEQIIAGE